MTDTAAIDYVHDTMRKKGITDYIWETVYVIGEKGDAAKGYFFIKATNQLYVLCDEEKYFGLLINSDNGVFNSDDTTKTVMCEHTGKIEFTKIGSTWNLLADSKTGAKAIPLKFVRATY
jgi:hypothetical protein